MKTVFLFPGQGAQYPGMASDLTDSEKVKTLFRMASDIMGADMKEMLMNSSPETLKRTDVSQPCITLANLAAAEYLAEKNIMPYGCAGFSLGEYAAMAVAKIISVEDCFYLVKERGKAMQAAIDRIQDNSGNQGLSGPANSPGMAAVIGLAPELVESFIAEWKKDGLDDLYSANLNSSKQVVVSGSAAALAEAEKRFMEASARRFIRLQVAGPYHSPLMNEAAEVFTPILEKTHFNDPVIPVFSNVTGKQIMTGAEAKSLALRQIVETVRWTDVQQSLMELQPDRFLETGPGKVLQGLWKDTGSAINCLPAGTAEDIGKII